jgi:hypothetical protein
MWGIWKTNGVALERGKKKKARMKVGRGGLSLYNLDPKQDSARRMTTGSVTKMFIGL